MAYRFVMEKLGVQAWSDIACPWCYIGKRRLEAALARFSHRDSVQVTWRAFELDPAAPRVRDTDVSYAERLAKKYGSSVAQAETRIRRVVDVAATDGLTFRFDRIRPGNTFDAHRLLHLAEKRGVQDAVKERFLLGYMTEGEAIGDPDVLSRLAREAGLDADEVGSVLATDAYASEVRDDEDAAREIGVNGVPFFLVGQRHAVSGAQPAEIFLRALQEGWAEKVQAGEADFPEGAACGPDGCS